MGGMLSYTYTASYCPWSGYLKKIPMKVQGAVVEKKVQDAAESTDPFLGWMSGEVGMTQYSVV